MSGVADTVRPLLPALAFLLGAVPLAHLLDRLGLFEALAEVLGDGADRLAGWWVAAAATTIVLNLDTTVVLLTPLFVRRAARVRRPPLAMAAIALLCANLASSVLPVSNLTTLVAAERLSIRPGALAAHLGPPTLVMLLVAGWRHHRRTSPHARSPEGVGPGAARAGRHMERGARRRALAVGGAVVVALALAFTVGAAAGLAPWVPVVVADAVLGVLLGWFPWRTVPLPTAAAVLGLGAVVGAVVPTGALHDLLSRPGPTGVLLAVGVAAVAAAAVDNLPAVLVMLPALATAPPEVVYAALLGVNAGAALTPWGSLANLLWVRAARVAGADADGRVVAGLGVSIAGPALVAGALTLAAMTWWWP